MNKTDLALFRPKKLKINHSFKFKLDGRRPVLYQLILLNVLKIESLLMNIYSGTNK